MPIDERIVREVAALAHLEIEEDRARSLARDLESVLDYVRSLDEVDVSSVPPTPHVLRAAPASRPDEPRGVEPPRGASWFEVPRVIPE